MHYSLTETPDLQASDCLVIGLFSDGTLPDFAQAIDKQHRGLLSRLAAGLKEKGDINWQGDVDGHSLMMIQCGEQNHFTPEALKKRCDDIAGYLLKRPIKDALICLPAMTERTKDWQLEHMILHLEGQHYQLLDFKSEKKKPHTLESVQFYLPGAHDASIQTAKSVAEGMHLTRTLANLPANVCTPTYLGHQAIELAEQYESLSAKVLHRDDMQELGMGALLAVAQGSHEPPQLIELKYNGANDAAPIVLVGKGITFDSGGISLKPPESMNEMKYDMAGAASVLGVLKACALLKLPVNVIGLVAGAENMPSGTAVKPGDVITSMSGKTIEITNTDAEGRLVLADALTYAKRFNPELVIDIATLTGAMIIALGNEITGFMTTDDDLAKRISDAAAESTDKAWRLPLDEAFQDALSSPIADMVNAASGRAAGSLTAACFLSRFTETFRWAHFDIAGTAWVSGKNHHATGRPVPLLLQIIRHAASSR